MNQFGHPMCTTVLVLCLLMSGCGNKGPLYLPNDPAVGERQDQR